MDSNLVRKGYDKAASDYDATRNQFDNLKYLEQFSNLIKKGRTVLDVGCGAGRPIDEFLVKRGLAVNGIDISPQMIALAQKNVPQAFYETKDMTKLQEGEYCVDGIVSLYAIFHTDRKNHGEILKKFASFMPNGGALLITMGAEDWEGSEENFHGAEMFWSHYGAEKNKELVIKAGFEIILNEIDTAGGEKHQVIVAKK
jgi:cyclopropane fatty-acyl-phospholipid synthase-like methyltransferase